MVHYTIDEALLSIDTIPRRVQQLVQQKLDAIESGIRVAQVQLVSVTWPRQVDEAFQAFVKASQTSGQAITQARAYAETTLNKAAGQVAEPLYRALQDPNVAEAQLAPLWTQVTGEVQDTLAQAQTYQTRVVERARANADYLLQILPKYQKMPELVLQEIYVNAMQQILANVDEKFILDKCANAKEREVRILVNRDALLKPKPSQTSPATK
jgi:membrane protease subunit HflK